MKVHLTPASNMSTAMFRIARVLRATMPANFTTVKTEDEADLLVLHVIGPEAIAYRPDKKVIAIQYCLGSSAAANVSAWLPLWNRALMTWSYYDLRHVCPRFYYAPLGISGAFVKQPEQMPVRDLGIFTSGYVAGPGAEAIEECILAAKQLGQTSVHLGPRPINMSPTTVCNSTGTFIMDDVLGGLYRRSRYVSGLRFVEGFEMPAVEGLACGARPIMFDRPDAHAWFDGHAVFVPEYSGYSLVRELINVLKRDPEPVTEEERKVVLAKFDWLSIGRGFWRKANESAGV